MSLPPQFITTAHAFMAALIYLYDLKQRDIYLYAPSQQSSPINFLPLVQFYGGKEALMRASFGLPSVAAEDAGEADKWKKRAIQVRACGPK